MEGIEDDQARRSRVIHIVLLASGLWLAASPYVLGFGWHAVAWWNAVVVGLCMVVLALLRFSNLLQLQGLRWTALVLGGWLLVSPFATEYVAVEMAMWNAVLVGGLIIVSAASAVQRPVRRPA